ncbi:MAG: methyltransferase [Planctomycetes bacterium]|nr:methyltransferase [Planctomycetota bacterium]
MKPNAQRTPDAEFEKGPLKASRDAALLQVLGIMTRDGGISADMRRKFQQVNHVVALFMPVLEKLPQERVSLVDANCGRSYLGFLLAHVLKCMGRQPVLFGYDRDPVAIGRCRERSRTLELADCEFLTGEAGSLQLPQQPQLFLSLHGCDTASDAALQAAVASAAQHVAVVPCCHREVRPLLGHEHEIYTRDGILADDHAAVFTDALRADWLRSHGYSTDVIEFVPLEHSARNRLIRGRRTERPDAAAPARLAAALAGLKAPPALFRAS